MVTMAAVRSQSPRLALIAKPMAVPEIIARLSHSLDAQATSVEPRLAPLNDIQAVLFDVYGTLLISASGDIGNASLSGRADAFASAVEAVGASYASSSSAGVDALHDAIRSQQSQLREHGTAHPEVDIVAAWRTLFGELSDNQLTELSVEYECRVNPIWPMPTASETLQRLRDSGFKLGIISNAQFFTPVAMEQLFGADLASLGFDSDLLFYSYEFLQAKPGRFLYEKAAAALAKQGIQPGQALYVGNDMLNDVFPANEVGFRTALFAGDRRSLRMRSDDIRVQGVEADWVVTRLSQITDALGL